MRISYVEIALIGWGAWEEPAMDEPSEELAHGLCDRHVGEVQLEFELELLKGNYEVKA